MVRRMAPDVLDSAGLPRHLRAALAVQLAEGGDSLTLRSVARLLAQLTLLLDHSSRFVLGIELLRLPPDPRSPLGHELARGGSAKPTPIYVERKTRQQQTAGWG